ncbi:MAG: substrate-binding domain-containing protein [Capsulimonadaceae bacterium]|nr:substrate-binding domain-containing protein [Capsulimonadaceae bacterium]
MIETQYDNGDVFFTEQSLVSSLSVSRVTVRRALDDLRREGLLERKVGRGTIVIKDGGLSTSTGIVRPGSTAAVDTIGIVFTGYYSEYCRAFIDVLGDECARRELHVDLVCTQKGTQLDKSLSRIATDPSKEALISFVTSDATLDLHNRLSARGYRSIAADGIPVGYHEAAVTTDARAAVRIAIEHLCSLGHERIALLVNEPMLDGSVTDKIDEFSIEMRKRGFVRSMQLVLCGTRYGESSHDAAYARMDEIWSVPEADRPTAIFVVSDPGAWAVLKWLHERNVSVPDEVSVIGFEDSRPSAHVTPALTTIAHPLPELAKRIVDLLVSGQDLSGVREYVPPRLVVRESTGPSSIPLSSRSR